VPALGISAGMNEDATAIPVRLIGVGKSFPGVTALQDVTLDLLAGETHGLVGENGAGKSTLIKIIAGAHPPDLGLVEIFGRGLADADPRAHQKAGVSVLYQERSIIPDLSAAANAFLAKTQRWGPFISNRATRRRFAELSEFLGAKINPEVRAGSLSVANQQLLEIMRALEANQRILILDEPTTALGGPERRNRYAVMNDLRKRGLAIIIISHDLDEILALSDRVTVMRDGKVVQTRTATEWSKPTLVNAMLGGVEIRRKSDRIIPSKEPILEIKDLSIEGILEGVSFTLQKGEILGVAGLVGSGRSELLRALAGADRGAKGQIEIDGRQRGPPRSVQEALRHGIALAPEDRRRQGLILSFTAAGNATLTNLKAVSSAGFVKESSVLRDAAKVMGGLGFNLTRLKSETATLSGGNQQKIVIGKWLYRRPKVLLLDEPTQGIDIGAKAEIFNVMLDLANQGTSIIFVSSEFEEIVEIADRVLVVGGGRSLQTLERDDISVKNILELLFAAEPIADDR
jgi:ABC-type sugar transport system ATPase subunit